MYADTLFTRWHHQVGASLIEVMIACVLGSLLTLGLIQIYFATQKTFTLQQAIVFMQENARFANHFLTTTIRMAGYAACDAKSDLTNPDLAIHGYQNALPLALQGKILKDTDSVVIGRCDLQKGSLVFQQLALFIGATTRKNVLGKTVYALYINPLGSDKSELVSNIDNMRITYGVTDASSQDVVQYLSADQVSNWRNVRAVDIMLLLSSDAPVLAKPEAYVFAGKTFPADRFLHRQWQLYIALREMNR